MTKKSGVFLIIFETSLCITLLRVQFSALAQESLVTWLLSSKAEERKAVP